MAGKSLEGVELDYHVSMSPPSLQGNDIRSLACSFRAGAISRTCYTKILLSTFSRDIYM